MKDNFEYIEKKLEKKYRHRHKRKNPTMVVSGKSVATLRRIIVKKADKNF